MPDPSDNGVNRIRTDQWHLQYLKTDDAHEINQGEGVTVAVPDTGVDAHPDLVGNLLDGINLTAEGSSDGHGDRDSHGTSMAGLIAAHGRTSATGALGIAPKAKILPVRFTVDHLRGDATTLARAVDYSVSHGAKIISISMAGHPDIELQRSVAAAVRADVVVVAGAGNRPRENAVAFPAAYPGVITVGGIDRSGEIAGISATGAEIDLVAPAVDIYSTSIDGNYSKGTGTSSATAIVAGAAALIRAEYPHLPAEEVAHRLTATAIDKGPPGRDDQYGYGVIDLVAALTADVPPLGFESTAPVSSPSPPRTARAQPEDDANAATTRGLITLGVIVATGGVWAVIVRRRRHSDPPPRISR